MRKKRKIKEEAVKEGINAEIEILAAEEQGKKDGPREDPKESSGSIEAQNRVRIQIEELARAEEELRIAEEKQGAAKQELEKSKKELALQSKLEKKRRKAKGKQKDKEKKGALSSLNTALKNVSYKRLRTQIKGYGYDYTLGRYLRNVMLVLFALVLVALLFNLKPAYLVIIAGCAIVSLPVIILAQFNYTSNNDRFEQLVNYMDQMIISFKNNPKILQAMESTLDITTGKMRECVEEAIEIIKTDTESPNVYLRAFAVIEKEFKSSRLRTLHRFCLTVERESSEGYEEALDNLYFDVREWVTRTYEYQASLGTTKSQITMILLMSIGIAWVFTYMLNSVQDGMGIDVLGSTAYQLSTLIFFLLYLLIYVILNTRVNGYWIVNDISSEKDEETLKAMRYISEYDPVKSRKGAVIAASLGIPIMIVGAILDMKLVVVLGGAYMVVSLLLPSFKYRSKKKAVERVILQEFPVWMRDIAISLNTQVVVKAVESSVETASFVMRPFLRNFLKNIENDPVSIRPYMEFMGEYNVSELSTAVKMLYSIRSMASSDSSRQINDLIMRNQRLLAQAEKQRHDDAIAGVQFITLAPMLIMGLKVMIDMGVMMLQFLEVAMQTF